MNLLDWENDYTQSQCCILLNSELKTLSLLNSSLFISKWNSSFIRICLDGAYNFIHSSPSILKPSIIIGDMDSITESNILDPSILILKDSCQNSTDFEKSIMYLASNMPNNLFLPIMVFGGLGGRFDHICSCINVILKYHNNFPIWVIDQSSIVTIVPIGETKIVIPSSKYNPCGLIPIVGRSVVKTNGLKWDIDGVLEMNHLISSSNEILPMGEVFISTDKNLLWTFKNLNQH